MVEQWSSKSHVWVRFLLPLLFKKKIFKNIFIIKKKKKTINPCKLKKFLQFSNFYKNRKENFFFLAKKQYLSSKFMIKPNESFVLFVKNYSFLFNYYFSYFYFYKNLYKSENFFNSVTFNNFIFLIVCFNKFFSFFVFNFINFYKNFLINNFNDKINYCKDGFKKYFFYYINLSLLFKNKKNLFQSISHQDKTYYNNFFRSSLLNISSFFMDIGSTLKVKNNTTSVPFKISSLSIKRFLFNFNYNKICFFRKNYKLRKFIKNNSKIFSYLVNSKITFSSFRSFQYLEEKKNINLFKLYSYDWITENLARLTKTSKRYNFSDYVSTNINFDNYFTLNSYCITNSFLNYYKNDKFFENNFFFLNKKSDKKFSNSLSKYKINLKNKSFSKNYFKNNINKNYSLQFYNKNFFKIPFSKLELTFFFFSSPLFFKISKTYKNLFKIQDSFSFFNVFSLIADSYFYSNKNTFFFNNIIPSVNFYYVVKKKMLKIFNYSKFSSSTSWVYYNSLTRFLEFCSGRKVHIKLNPFLNNDLTFEEKAQCLLWAQKVKYFRKVLGPRLFLNESIQIIYLSLKLKDPYILSNWLVSTMGKISFWKYKTFLRYIKYLLRYFFWVIFKELKLKGIKFQLKGKISVAGNARTRTVFHNVGFTSHTTFNNKILYKLNLVRTFTGVLGLKLWIVF